MFSKLRPWLEGLETQNGRRRFICSTFTGTCDLKCKGFSSRQHWCKLLIASALFISCFNFLENCFQIAVLIDNIEGRFNVLENS